MNLEEGAWVKAESKSPPVTGCDLLWLPAELQAQPTTHESDKPSGMEFELKVPQSETMGVEGTPTLKKIVTSLPEGFTIDPSAGSGLQACSEVQIGWLGGQPSELRRRCAGVSGSFQDRPMELETPLVAHKFDDEMFLPYQNENPFGATLAAYVVVNDPITGVVIKVAGEVRSQQAGRPADGGVR